MIIEWVLVLMVNDTHPAMVAVPGFDSRTTCDLAGRQVSRDFEKEIRYDSPVVYSCIRRDKASPVADTEVHQ